MSSTVIVTVTESAESGTGSDSVFDVPSIGSGHASTPLDCRQPWNIAPCASTRGIAVQLVPLPQSMVSLHRSMQRPIAHRLLRQSASKLQIAPAGRPAEVATQLDTS